MSLVPTKSLELENKPIETLSHLIYEQERCAIDPLYFLRNYGKIRDKTKGIIPFTSPPHIIKLFDTIREYRFIIILKAKQIYVTWSMAGNNLHLATFHKGANILTLSKGEDEATESLDYSRFIHDNLPSFLRLEYGKNQSSLITFPSMHSKLRALPSTEDAGVGFGGATRVVMDEFEYHKYDRANYSEILAPILDGGQLVILSTADRLKVGTLFKELYVAAKHGDNNFYPLFFPYDVLPNRTQEWYDSIDLPKAERECRFPRIEEEALQTSKTSKFFDFDRISQMYSDVISDDRCLKHELSDKYRGLVRIYKLKVVGRKYVQFTDPSEGKEDKHVCVVVDAITGEEVAESHGKVSADKVAEIHDALAREYGAFNSWESGPGGAGGIMSTKLAEMDTPNRCPSLNVGKRPFMLDRKSGKLGWWTSSSLWDVAIQSLEEDIRLGRIIPHSKECIDEFNSFIQPEGEKPCKTPGASDDYVDAWARISLLRKYVPTSSTIIISS